MKYLLFILIAILVAACSGTPSDSLSEPVASIDEMTLTKRELYDAIPANMSKEDSTIFAQDYITRWVKSQLLLRKAELNLTPEEKDFEKLLTEYRTSLITHLYQQKLIEQKYAPLITSSEIESYYHDMRDNFKLKDIIIKGVFIKIPRTAPNLSQVEYWYKSSNQSDLVNLDAYCYQNAKKYENFLDQWIPLSNLDHELPNSISNPSQTLQWQKNFTDRDLDFQYYLSIRDVKYEGEYAPLEFVEVKIKSILLNKKRIDFIKQLENDLYEEGLQQKIVRFY